MFYILHNIARLELCILHSAPKHVTINIKRSKGGYIMAAGRYKEWLKEENLIRLQGWRRDGLSYEQIAANMGINAGTLYVWVKKYPEIYEALKKGEEVMIYQVENALYKSAMGYEVTETDQTETLYPDGSKTVTKHARKRHIPPSVGAICFILKNRRSDKWQDKPIVQDTTAIDKLDEILKGVKDAVQSETEGVHKESEPPV